ncbi:MAG: NADH-quinone oxidoreductase subunit L [Halofilum sp. (in: g-proteobacteria)]
MMQAWLWLIPALPLAGFVLIALLGAWLGRSGIAAIAVGAVGASALAFAAIAGPYLVIPPYGGTISQTLWQWIGVGELSASVGLLLDPLSLVMVAVITGVGFLIHLYSATYMAAEPGYRRYFAYLNLFVFGMLTLVLADNLLLLYLGWEMVGLCSYLLIGLYYEELDNGRAARKAFVVTRIGDAAMAVGLFLLFTEFGTLHLPTLLERAPQVWNAGDPLAIAAAALLLAGAVGKSAQVPLQIWLPDAMAGPSPVSALIHAATMVTAGVYLIARTHVLFELAPPVQTAVAVIGAVTLLLAACSALVQRDIKRVLAYSTISQIGYMVLALGVGAYTAAMFHFMTHAFFKALLFLAAGVVIVALHDEHDIYRMGGLRRRLPGTTLAFGIGAASLAALPLVTAGFYSKELILAATYESPAGGAVLWAVGVLAAFITSVYIFRVFFVAFLGREGATPIHRGPSRSEGVVLAVLSVLAVIGGFVDIPQVIGGFQPFSAFMHHALPEVAHREGAALGEGATMLIATVAALLGIAVAWLLYGRREADEAEGGALTRFWRSGWGFDAVYGWLFVRPFVAIARGNKGDFVDGLYSGIARLTTWGHRHLSESQSGLLRAYAAGIAGGAIVLIAIVVLP